MDSRFRGIGQPSNPVRASGRLDHEDLAVGPQTCFDGLKLDRRGGRVDEAFVLPCPVADGLGVAVDDEDFLDADPL